MNEAVAQDTSPKRGPGRPPNPVEVKKGNSTWKPASILDVFEKEPGYVYRIAEKSAKNIAKKQREGWEIVSAIQSPNTGNNSGNSLDRGTPMTSVVDGYDYVVMRITEELAQMRHDYFNNENSRRMSALRKQTKEDLGRVGKDGAPVHGTIEIAKKGIRTIIKD